MSNLFQKALSLITGSEPTEQAFSMPKKRLLKGLTERELIQLESEIGRQLFGDIPAGVQREFFNLDATTWIWYEEMKDAKGVVHTTTTRYEVKDNGVLKAQDGARYSYLEGDELANFGVAVQMYYEQVMRGIYKRNPATGEKLS